MFVKKLVEKATKKGTDVPCSRFPAQNAAGSGINGLRPEDVKPRIAFHYGIPPDSSSLAYHPIQQILAISTRNGVIKLFGRDNAQALLQSDYATPSKFLQFMEGQAVLLNVTSQNHVEVWNIEKKQLSHVHIFNEEITSIAVVQQSFYIYVGDCLGDVTVLKLDLTSQCLVQMPYRIPSSESHGTSTDPECGASVIFTSPQPMAENKRILIIFRDGLITLWGIQESKAVFVAGGNAHHSSHEPKTVVSACWACIFGSKVVVGYSSGDIFLWAVPVISDIKSDTPSNQNASPASQTVPLLRLNLGYRTDKIPIVSLRWFAYDESSGYLYVNGFNDIGSSHSFQVIIINGNTQSRTIKLALPLTEPCLAMEIVSCSSNQMKNKQNILVLLLRSGRLYIFDDSEINNYLSLCQSKSHPTVPKQLMVTLPVGESSITVAKLYIAASTVMDEDQLFLPNKYHSLFSMNERVGSHQNSTQLSGLSKAKNLLVTGHVDGTVNFWDASCPLLLPIMSIKQQLPESSAPIVAPVTSLYFDVSSRLLVSGVQSGLIQIFFFKKEQQTAENILSFLQAKQGDNYTVQCVKLKGAITSICVNMECNRLAVGTDKGYVSVIQVEGAATILYQKQIPSQLYSGIISLKFGNCVQNGLEKEILLVGMEDASVVALEEGTGHALSSNPIRTKNPSKALLMCILDASQDGVSTPDCQDPSKDSYSKQFMQKQPLILLCSEDAIRLYALGHAVQGTKKAYGKKKLDGRCCYASIVHGPSLEVGLVLIFACGKMEIRSLPDLAVLNEVSLRGLIYPILRSPQSSNVFCASSEGELLLVNGDQAMLFLSVLSQKEVYRHLECITKVYSGNLSPREGTPIKTPQKEKKKGILSMVFKEMKGNKTKQTQESDTDGPNASEELSAIFSTFNYTQSDELRNISGKTNDEEFELDIDDIDIEDTKEKHKGPSFPVLNKEKLGKKLHALKGKLKSNVEKINSPKDEHEEEKNMNPVDQIKQKYGYTRNDESNIAKVAEEKLRDNVAKLKAIGLRTSEMESNAQTFSSMAKGLLQATQSKKST